jgi:hypothetical protein
MEWQSRAFTVLVMNLLHPRDLPLPEYSAWMEIVKAAAQHSHPNDCESVPEG